MVLIQNALAEKFTLMFVLIFP